MIEKSKNLNKFIEYKKEILKERPILTAESKLITIDGVDGSGKSTIARMLFEKLKKIYGDNSVVLFDITNLKGSPKQEKLKKLEQIILKDDVINKIYATGVNRAYEELVSPALKENKIVIIDRSEVDLLRFAFENGDNKSVELRKKYIKEGDITHNLWAGNRIFIELEANDIWQNLLNRQNSSGYDPKSFEEVKERIKAEKQAENEVMEMPHNGQIKILREKNLRIEELHKRENYLNELIDRLINNLNFTN